MKKRWMSGLLALAMTLGLLGTAPGQAKAANATGVPIQTKQDWSGANRFNAWDSSVSKPKTGYIGNYYLFDNGDGSLSALIAEQEVIHLERYDRLGNLTAQKEIPRELSTIGAFCAGGGNFYLAYGQANPDEEDSLEVWRIVKYDLNGNRLGSVSANGGETYTTEPYRSTVARMALSSDGKTLVLYASRTRYTSDDGLRHQSNITFHVNADTMTWKKIDGAPFPANHVSHSFGQFVRFDGENVVTVDHGDAYPRSFYLQTPYYKMDLLEIYGKTGDNVTNAIGSGFEVSEDGYLFLGCSAPQTASGGTWNVFLSYMGKAENLPKTLTLDNGITVSTERPKRAGMYWIKETETHTYYIWGDENIDVDATMRAYFATTVGEPSFTWMTSATEDIKCARLVKLDDNSFVAMWQQGNDIHWQLLNGKGQKEGLEKTLSGVTMPPNQPVVVGRSIRWIQLVEKTPMILTLDVDYGVLTTPGNEPEKIAYPSTQNVLVDGTPIEFQCYALKDSAGNSTNFIRLRDVADILDGTTAQFDVTWDGAVNIVTGQGYAPNGTERTTPFEGERKYEDATATTLVNGKAQSIRAILLKDDGGNGYTYYKLRDLGKALGFEVDWSADKGIFVTLPTTSTAPTEIAGDETDEDFDDEWDDTTGDEDPAEHTGTVGNTGGNSGLSTSTDAFYDGTGLFDITYAEKNWVPRTITFNANGGTFSDGSTTKEITYDHYYFTELPESPTLEGYSFANWGWGFGKPSSGPSWYSPNLKNPIPDGVDEIKAIWISKKNGDIIYDTSKLTPFDFHAEVWAQAKSDYWDYTIANRLSTDLVNQEGESYGHLEIWLENGDTLCFEGRCQDPDYLYLALGIRLTDQNTPIWYYENEDGGVIRSSVSLDLDTIQENWAKLYYGELVIFPISVGLAYVRDQLSYPDPRYIPDSFGDALALVYDENDNLALWAWNFHND